VKFRFAVKRSSLDLVTTTDELTKNGVDVVDLTGAEVINSKTNEVTDKVYVIICRASRVKYRRLKRESERRVFYMGGVKVLA